MAGLISILAIAGTGCKETAPAQKLEPSSQAKTTPASASAAQPASTKANPLLLDDQPLLLSDDTPKSKSDAGPEADNSRCHVCHMNFAVEELAVTHARANIGCVRCHGASDAHIADESWASGGNGTAPDIMYPQAKINAFCLACHPKGKLNDAAHQEVLLDSAGKFCTDCHGKHRLAKRKCKWK